MSILHCLIQVYNTSHNTSSIQVYNTSSIQVYNTVDTLIDVTYSRRSIIVRLFFYLLTSRDVIFQESKKKEGVKNAKNHVNEKTVIQ